ncbi:MAG: penicillin-binding protein 1B [Oceanospirillaceae bacterium]|nr:penicillin-binding protein 1B [Oceanospirillaceae bacterium]
MTKKRASAKKPGPSGRKGKTARKAPRRSFRSALFGFLLKLTLVLSVFAAIGLAYLDMQVRDKFEGKRWALPAKVYGRPLELYPGQPLAMDDLKAELKGLGYRFVKSASGPGQAEWASSRVRLHTRGFVFPDGYEPSRDLLLDFRGGTLSRVRDASGNLPLARLEPVLVGGIYPNSNEDRDLIRLSEAPPYLAEALIGIEDRSFYDHHGISLKGIARAMWVNIQAGRFVQGGSTLTQQLIKNFYLTADRTLARKLLEVPMAVLLELHYSKDEILEAYLNEVYLGQSGARAIHGFGLGSQYYFGRPIQELQLHQVALLAGLVKGPSYFDPRRHPERAKQRRDLVLSILAERGQITPQQLAEAQARGLDVVQSKSLQKGAYPAYLDLVKRQLREDYREEDLSSEGLRVFTSLDPIVHRRAEEAMVETTDQLVKRYGKKLEGLQGSMVVTDPQTGDALAIIGGRDTRFQGFNRALDADRSIGSLVKPAVYLAALEQGYTLASPIEDEPVRLKLPNGDVWAPDNFDHQAHGVVPLHRALAKSYNLATAHLGLDIGVDKVVDMLHRLGLERDINAYPALLLGGQTMSPVEVANIYQTLAANGFQTPLRAIRMVTDADGQELSRYPFKVRQTVPVELVHLIQYAMQEVVREGTARYAYSQLPADLNIAGKTGTSNNQRDSWFAGFTGNRLAVVWLGRDDNAPMPITGSSGALRVWTDFMRREHPQPYLATRPDDIEYVWVDDATGLRSGQYCDGARQLPFLVGTAPQQGIDCGGNPVQQSVDWFRNWFR